MAIAIYTIEEIDTLNGSLKITHTLGERGTRLSFDTEEDVEEWDEIIVENEYNTRLFAGIVDSVDYDKTNNLSIRGVESGGYQRLFDRQKVSDDFTNQRADQIVAFIVATYCPGFTVNNVPTSGTPTIPLVLFNHALPSEAIRRIADAIGYDFYIDSDKDVHLFVKAVTPAQYSIDSTSNFHKSLRISPDVSNYVNQVTIRGGTYRSVELIYEKKGDGVTKTFLLPEKPHDVTVQVNGVGKTLGIKFGTETPTTEFILNYNEKYVENGTHAVLGTGDTLKVLYKYDVPLRLRAKDEVAIAAMKAIYPETNGIFEIIIEDKDINDRDVARKLAEQKLAAYTPPVVQASFKTNSDLFAIGEQVSIDVPEFTGSAVVQSITFRCVGGSEFTYDVKLATVLYGFEDFLRSLIAAKKIELIDGEVVEILFELEDGLGLAETVTASIDQNRKNETLGVDDDSYTALNVAKTYVLTPYWPTGYTDTKRAFILDASPMS